MIKKRTNMLKPFQPYPQPKSIGRFVNNFLET